MNERLKSLWNSKVVKIVVISVSVMTLVGLGMVLENAINSEDVWNFTEEVMEVAEQSITES